MTLPNIGPMELIIILVIVLLIFGAGRLATVGGALGKAVRDFKEAVRGGEEEESEGEKVRSQDETTATHEG